MVATRSSRGSAAPFNCAHTDVMVDPSQNHAAGQPGVRIAPGDVEPADSKPDAADAAAEDSRFLRSTVIQDSPRASATPADSDARPSDASHRASASGEVDTNSPDVLAEYPGMDPPEADDEIGRLGGYHVKRVLDGGGMGVVFEAWDPSLRRRVAIKAMKASVAAIESAGERFLREARATAAVQHEHVITIYQVGEQNGMPFLVMELLQGESLDVRLKRDAAMPIEEVVRIGRQAAEGLAAAHAKALLHRDIKPANIWLGEGGSRVKILDFGLAKVAGEELELTRTGQVLGTPRYMSPEQAAGREADLRSDLFSLGSVLYRLATGRHAFDAANLPALLVEIRESVPLPPCEIKREIPPEFSAVIMRLLEKAPEDRYPSAEDLAEDLAAIASALPPPSIERQRARRGGRVGNGHFAPQMVGPPRALLEARGAQRRKAGATWLTVAVWAFLVAWSWSWLAAAYITGSQEGYQAWDWRYSRLGHDKRDDGGIIADLIRTTPEGMSIGWLFEGLRTLLAVTVAAFLIPAAFPETLRRLFAVRNRATWRDRATVAARLVFVFIVLTAGGLESYRHLSPEGAGRELYLWAQAKGIYDESTVFRDDVTYRLYLPYSLIMYVVVVPTVLVVPAFHFLTGDGRRVEEWSDAWRTRMATASHTLNLPAAGNEVLRFARPYLNIFALLCCWVCLEIWIGRYTLSKAGLIQAWAFFTLISVPLIAIVLRIGYIYDELCDDLLGSSITSITSAEAAASNGFATYASRLLRSFGGMLSLAALSLLIIHTVYVLSL